MEVCVTPLPEVSDASKVAGGALKKWPQRLTAVPPRISRGSIKGVTSKAFVQDTELWRKRVQHYKGVINQFEQKGRYRNVLDMNAGLGGFAAALASDPLWVMNMVPTVGNSSTLGVVYERGLIGSYQDWLVRSSTLLCTVMAMYALAHMHGGYGPCCLTDCSAGVSVPAMADGCCSTPSHLYLHSLRAGARACPLIHGRTISSMRTRSSPCTRTGNARKSLHHIQFGTNRG